MSLTVIIPVKNRLDLTAPLVTDLQEQGGYDRLVVYDNGSTDGTRKWCDDNLVQRVNADGWSLHEMWNAGLDQTGGHAVFLNNDLKLDDQPQWLRRLCLPLDAGWAATCPNYDDREGEGVERLHGIAADSGLAGFAFAIQSTVAARYRFPTELRWWCGDTDFACTMDVEGLVYGMVKNCKVTHIGGGSQTPMSPEQKEEIKADRVRFRQKWRRYYSFA
jgi:glycosyltransferase involved in cell wall biosynthesis